MRTCEFSAEVVATLNAERFSHPHPAADAGDAPADAGADVFAVVGPALAADRRDPRAAETDGRRARPTAGRVPRTKAGTEAGRGSCGAGTRLLRRRGSSGARFVLVLSVVNQQTFRELLSKIAALNLTGPITVVLDNARYQHCAAGLEFAASLGIELLFLPSYSPNLNLIERLWKFIKKDCLYARHFASFADFRGTIENCLSQLGTTHKAKLATLMTLNFQTFNNRSILAA